MKILIALIILISTQISFANSECFLQAKSKQDFQSLEKRDYFIGEIQASVAGELDPFTLGDGGLVVLRSNEGSIAIYEANEGADNTNNIFDDAALGFRYIAVKKECIEKVNLAQKDAMESLIVRILNLEEPRFYFIFN